MIEVKFTVPVRAKAQVYANKNSDTEEIIRAIKEEMNNWEITDMDDLELEIDYQSMEDVDFEGWF